MSDVTTIGLLHPGEMGAAVGKCLAGAGHRVLWVPEGRSAATKERAAEAGLDGVRVGGDGRPFGCHCFGLPAARGAGRGPAGGRRSAASTWTPTRSRRPPRVRWPRSWRRAGPASRTAGSSGLPRWRRGLTRLYLSGPRAGEVQALFGGTDVDARVVPPPGSASAVKMAYASWTKGSAALLLAARALARAEGVEPVLLEEWGISQPGLERRSAAATRVRDGQGLALGRRDGGDRRDHGRGRAPRRVPPGRGRDLPRVSAGAEALG